MHRKGLEALIKERYKENQLLYGVEIGCFQGELCQHLLNAFPRLHLTTIDPKANWNDVFERCKDYQDRLHVMPLTSDEACKFINFKAHFIFIDGDHEYEQCKKDILNYQGFVRRGGILSGHNYHKGPVEQNGFASGGCAHPGVHLSVDEIFGDKVKLAPDFIWYV